MNKELDILSVNISEKKGTVKLPVKSIELTATGIINDAHAGRWHRQVSLLGIESFRKMEHSAGRKLNCGEFAENITTSGLELFSMHPLDRLTGKQVSLEVTQIGKKCHGERCAIFKQTGDCVMPREGIFCRVLHGGILQAGDRLEYEPKVIRVSIITLSDRASAGEYEDKSGPQIRQQLENYFSSQGRPVAFEMKLLPDEIVPLQNAVSCAVNSVYDIIITTGGTGISPRDMTPDVIKPMLTKEIPGIMEMIRVKYGMRLPNALISRSIAGVIGRTLVYVLPGSPGAVKEYMTEILPTIEHSLMMLHGIDKH